MTADRDVDTRRQEASSWFARLNQKRISSADVVAFGVWRRDPLNAAAYDKVEALWTASEALAGDPDIAAASSQALNRNEPRKPHRAKASSVLGPLGAVGALAVLALAGTAWFSSRPAPYETEVGERRVVQLADGSSLTLDTATEVKVRLERGRRQVTIERGQAFFDVEGDPDRPFIVTAGDTRVTALGTRFEVRRRGRGARVVLLEGRIDVRTDRAAAPPAWTLRPGQSLSTDVARPKIETVDVRKAAGWTTGRLIFEATPLRSAIAEVNRYSLAQVELRDAGLADVNVSGAFDAGDTDAFVAALQDLYGVRVVRTREGAVQIFARPREAVAD